MGVYLDSLWLFQIGLCFYLKCKYVRQMLNQEGKGTQEDFSALWLAVSGFIVMEFISGLLLDNHSDQSFLVANPSWWPVHPGGPCIAQPRWMPVRRILGGGTTCGIFLTFPRILPFGGGLLVPCSLLGPPVVK